MYNLAIKLAPRSPFSKQVSLACTCIRHSFHALIFADFCFYALYFVAHLIKILLIVQSKKTIQKSRKSMLPFCQQVSGHGT